MTEAPLVSVAIITYNHREYIGQALESVLNQRRDFPIEIVISDDCSPDNTAEVIDRYQAAHPSMFRRVDPPENVGFHANLDRVWRECRGKYVAVLEGDDWWHSPDKLALQVEFMEQHPDVTVCGHRALQVPEVDGKRETKGRNTTPPELGTVEDLIWTNYIATCSVIFRRGVVDEIPTWVRQLPLADWPLFLLHAVHGKVGYINQTLSTYRLHSGGVWSSLGMLRQHRNERDALLLMRDRFPRTFRRAFDVRLEETCFDLYYACRTAGEYRESRKYLLEHIRYALSTRRVRPNMLLKYPVLLLFPHIGHSRGEPTGGC